MMQVHYRSTTERQYVAPSSISDEDNSLIQGFASTKINNKKGKKYHGKPFSVTHWLAGI